MRDAYAAFERVVMPTELPVALEADPSVNGGERDLVLVEEGEGSNVEQGGNQQEEISPRWQRESTQ